MFEEKHLDLNISQTGGFFSVYLSCVCCFLANKPKETPACRREAAALTVQCIRRKSKQHALEVVGVINGELSS